MDSGSGAGRGGGRPLLLSLHPRRGQGTEAALSPLPNLAHFMQGLWPHVPEHETAVTPARSSWVLECSGLRGVRDGFSWCDSPGGRQPGNLSHRFVPSLKGVTLQIIFTRDEVMLRPGASVPGWPPLRGRPVQVTAVAPRPSQPAPSSSLGTCPTMSRAALVSVQ